MERYVECLVEYQTMTEIENKRDVIEKCVALKKMPHVFDKVKNVRGYPEFFEYVDNLLMVEPGREGRAGFPEGVYKEIDALKRIYMKFPDEVMAPELNADARKQVKEMIKDIETRLHFSVGDRR